MNIDFFDIEIGALTLDEIAGKVLEFATRGKRRFITYLNASCLNISSNNHEYKKILKSANLVYAGGQGIVWAARFLGVPLPERVNILDFFDILANELSDKKIRIYLLGGRPDAIKKAEEALKKKGLNIIGSRYGFFDEIEETEIIREINILKPNILMVGMGVPKQEKWIYKHLGELDVNLCWAVGGFFDILAGRFKITPRWISKYGLEWLYLGLQDPRRLLRRYLFGNFIFVYRVVKHKLGKASFAATP